MASELGLRPWEFRRYTYREFRVLVDAHVRREARADDDRARAVAHLMLATGNYGRSTTVSELMRGYLGRDPGEVPGTAVEGPSPSAESDVLFMKHLVLSTGGAVRRRESA